MLRDIFIDNDCAKNFANPVDPDYKRLVRWLREYDESHLDRNAVLAVSNKLIAEYGRTCAHSTSSTSIWAIIDLLNRQDRLNKIAAGRIKQFKCDHFKKHLMKRMRCRAPDRDHIPVVLLSDRKMALSRDNAFISALFLIPGFHVTAARRPMDLPYDT